MSSDHSSPSASGFTAPDASQARAAAEQSTGRVGAPAGVPKDRRRGRYVLTRVLGEGGMGTVYAAFDPQLHREVAIKIVRHQTWGDQERLQREAIAMAQIHHPNVVAIHDVDIDEHGVSLVMELVDGPDLVGWLDQKRPDWETIVEAFLQAGRGLAYAHSRGLVHRDFKPGNILVSRGDVFKVTDFGLAKPLTVHEASTHGVPFTMIPMANPAVNPRVPLAANITQTGVVLGTLRYMAPEQHLARTVDARADQFSFCVAMWSALYGAPPYGGSEPELLRGKLEGPPRRPASRPAIPTRLWDALRKGLEPQPTNRFRKMDDLLAEIERSMKRTPVGRWVLLGVLGVGAAAGLVTVGAMTAENAAPDAPQAPEPVEPAVAAEPPKPEEPRVQSVAKPVLAPDVGAPGSAVPKPPFALRSMEVITTHVRSARGVIEMNEALEESGPFIARSVCDGPLGPTVFYDQISAWNEPSPAVREAGAMIPFELSTFIFDTELYPLEPPCEIQIGVEDKVRGRQPPVYACWDGDKVSLERCKDPPAGADTSRPDGADVIVDHVTATIACEGDCLELYFRARSFVPPVDRWVYESKALCRHRKRKWEDYTYSQAKEDGFAFVPGERREFSQNLFYLEGGKFDLSKSVCELTLGAGSMMSDREIAWRGCLDHGELRERPCSDETPAESG